MQQVTFMRCNKLSILFMAIAVSSFCQEAQQIQRVVITATNKHGKAAPITKEMLKVEVDGEAVGIESLTPAKDQPLVFALLLDSSGSMRDKEAFSKDAARSLFNALAAGGAKAYFGVFGERTEITAAPTQMPQVKEIVSKALPRGYVSVSNAIAKACTNSLSRNSNPLGLRRAVVVVTDGEDQASKADIDNAIEVAQREGVSVVILGLLPDQDTNNARDKIRTIAFETGGTALLMNGPGEYLHKLLSFFERQYVVTFTDSKHSDRGLHTLDVTSLNTDIRISAPKKFLVQ